MESLFAQRANHFGWAKHGSSFDATPHGRFATGWLVGGACAYDLLTPASADGVRSRVY